MQWIALGIIRCIAWPVAFPSGAERILWRVSSIVITGSPISLALWVVLEGFNLHVPGTVVYLVNDLLFSALPAEAYLSVHWTTLI